jgi:hypothetical protein
MPTQAATSLKKRRDGLKRRGIRVQQNVLKWSKVKVFGNSDGKKNGTTAEILGFVASALSHITCTCEIEFVPFRFRRTEGLGNLSFGSKRE